MSFNPIVGVSYTKYLEQSQLDGVGFTISGPLRLRLEGLGDGADSVSVTADVARGTGAVSAANTQRATSTKIGGGVLYTHHWGSPRWKSEFGYTYAQVLYDDAAYKDRDSITHTLSAATLYALNREVDVGVRTSYAQEEFSDGTRLASDTWDVEGLVRWQVTSKVKSELALGRETAVYQDGGSESGITARGALDYQVTPRWHCAAMVRRQLEPSDLPGRTGVTTTSGGLKVSYRFTPKLTGALAPGVMSQTGQDDDQITEISFGVEATYAFRLVDLTASTRVIDRTADENSADTYRAVDAAVRVTWGAARGAGALGGRSSR